MCPADHSNWPADGQHATHLACRANRLITITKILRIQCCLDLDRHRSKFLDSQLNQDSNMPKPLETAVEFLAPE